MRKKSEPKLSVIVPVYNEESYLRECLESICAQSFADIEIICVDDGSTDDSKRVLVSYTQKDDRIRVISKSQNEGLVAARKTGVGEAKGAYIGFVDADDWIEPNMYECLMNEVEEHDADVVSCGYYLDKDNTRRVVNATEKKMVIDSRESREFFFKGALAKGFDWLNSRNISPSVCNKVFRKSILSNIYKKIDDRVIWDEDTITVLSAILESKSVVLIPEISYHYRINHSSMSYRLNKEVIKNYIYVFDELERISKEYEGVLDNQIPYYSLAAARTSLEVGFGVESGKQYIFPFGEIASESRIVIYGAGQVGRCYYKELTLTNYASQLYITDSNPRSWSGDVISPDKALKKNFDIVLIAVENENTANIIKSSIIEKGIPENKVIWHKPIMLEDTYTFWKSNTK